MTHDELPKGYKPTNTIDIIAGAGRKHEQTRLMTHDKSANTNGFNTQTRMADDETYQIDNFDELLAEVTASAKAWEHLHETENPLYEALRAVVELCANRDFVTIGDKSIFNSGRNSVKEEIIQAIEEQIK